MLKVSQNDLPKSTSTWKIDSNIAALIGAYKIFLHSEQFCVLVIMALTGGKSGKIFEKVHEKIVGLSNFDKI